MTYQQRLEYELNESRNTINLLRKQIEEDQAILKEYRFVLVRHLSKFDEMQKEIDRLKRAK